MISTLAAEDESDGLTVDGGVPSNIYPGDGDPRVGGAGTGGVPPSPTCGTPGVGTQSWSTSTSSPPGGTSRRTIPKR